MKNLLTVEQFAQAIGFKPATVRQKVWKRELEFIKIGRAIRFRPELVDEMIKLGTVPAKEDR